MSGFSVAIDGPGGAGKSTVARLLARELGFIYIDTGAMYRAAALYCIENGVPFECAAVARRLGQMDITIAHVDGEQRIFLNARDVTEAIRTPRVSAGASEIAVFPQVREKLVALQRALAAVGNVVMDGRDIGTQVLPSADVKIYLDAGVDERARRRQAELASRGMVQALDEIKREVAERDRRDTTRAHSPLRRAEDATVIDASALDADEVKDRILEIIQLRRRADVL